MNWNQHSSSDLSSTEFNWDKLNINESVLMMTKCIQKLEHIWNIFEHISSFSTYWTCMFFGYCFLVHYMIGTSIIIWWNGYLVFKIKKRKHLEELQVKNYLVSKLKTACTSNKFCYFTFTLTNVNLSLTVYWMFSHQ